MFRFKGCWHHLSISVPLNFVPQVLLSPCMKLNACLHRLNLGLNVSSERRGATLTSNTQPSTPALPKPGFEPGTVGMESRDLNNAKSRGPEKRQIPSTHVTLEMRSLSKSELQGPCGE